jgi:hypothetical protein
LRIQILATEHWSLLATRSHNTWNESFARAQMLLSVLAASVIALALVAQATGFGSGFTAFALVLLPVVLLLGVTTYIRAGSGVQVREERPDLLAHAGGEDLGTDRVDQLLGVRAGEGGAAFAQRPADDLGVAVGRPLHLPPAVVDVEPRPAEALQRAQLVLVGIGAFEVRVQCRAGWGSRRGAREGPPPGPG